MPLRNASNVLLLSPDPKQGNFPLLMIPINHSQDCLHPADTYLLPNLTHDDYPAGYFHLV